MHGSKPGDEMFNPNGDRARLKRVMLRESDMKFRGNTLKSAGLSGRRLRKNWVAYTFYHLKFLGYR
jgi:hypothetical protein